MLDWHTFNLRMDICGWFPSVFFPAADYSGLDEIVSKFLQDPQPAPDIACFGIAGPVHNGRVETSNLPWVIEQSRLAKQIQLPATLLINDLEANAWGIASAETAGSGSAQPCDGPPVGNQAVIAPGTGLGRSRALLGWQPARFSRAKAATPTSRREAIADRTVAASGKPLWPRQLRACALRAGPGQCL